MFCILPRRRKSVYSFIFYFPSFYIVNHHILSLCPHFLFHSWHPVPVTSHFTSFTSHIPQHHSFVCLFTSFIIMHTWHNHLPCSLPHIMSYSSPTYLYYHFLVTPEFISLHPYTTLPCCSPYYQCSFSLCTASIYSTRFPNPNLNYCYQRINLNELHIDRVDRIMLVFHRSSFIRQCVVPKPSLMRTMCTVRDDWIIILSWCSYSMFAVIDCGLFTAEIVLNIFSLVFPFVLLPDHERRQENDIGLGNWTSYRLYKFNYNLHYTSRRDRMRCVYRWKSRKNCYSVLQARGGVIKNNP